MEMTEFAAASTMPTVFKDGFDGNEARLVEDALA